MSENSIWTNLKNKVVYHTQKAVTDPAANEYAEKQQKQVEEKKQKEEEQKKIEATEKEGDLNKFSATRLAKKVGNQTLNILRWVISPFLGIVIGMFVANEMMMYSAPIRLIFFLFIFVLCTFLPFVAIILTIFYILKGGYSYYINNMTNGPKRVIMPYIYAILPLTTRKPSSLFLSTLMFPFTYPKQGASTEALQYLENIPASYFTNLVESFKAFPKVSSKDPFPKRIEEIRNSLSLVNKLPSVEPEF